MSLQFHAMPEEVVTWVNQWAYQWGLNVAYEFSSAEAYWVEVIDTPPSTAPEALFRLSLSPHPMRTDVSSTLEFISSNRDLLVVHPGRLAAGNLGESTANAATSEAQAIKTYRSIFRDLKKSMRRGATVINEWTGARADAKNHYYSEAALRAARNGVRMAVTEAVAYELHGM